MKNIDLIKMRHTLTNDVQSSVIYKHSVIIKHGVL